MAADAGTYQRRWESEVCVLSAPSRAELQARARRLALSLPSRGEIVLKDVAFTLNQELAAGPPTRLSVVASSVPELAQRLAAASERLEDPTCTRIKDASGVYFFQEPPEGPGRIAVLFPGEGSQYPNMLADLCMHFPEVRQWFDLMDRAFSDHRREELPSQFIFPPAGANGDGDATRLWQMDGAVEAVFAANQALLALLRRLNVRVDAMAGHSSGDYSALLASGCWQVDGDPELIRRVLELNAVYEPRATQERLPEARLLAVASADRSLVEELIAGSEEPLYLALDNCPHQVVLCGTPEAVRRTSDALRSAGAVCGDLPFARAYHTPLFENLAEPLTAFFRALRLTAPAIETYSCATAAPYPADPSAIREIATAQWTRPVRFRETIEAMYDAGVRVFIEAGPRGNLTAFVEDILRGRPVVAAAMNTPHRTAVSQINHVVGLLAAHGVSMNLDYLYARRAPRLVSLGDGAPELEESPLDVDKGVVRLSLRLPTLRLGGAAGRPTLGRLETSAMANARTRPVSLDASLGRDGANETRTRAMKDHIEIMQRFLQVEQEIMDAYLGAAPAPLSAPAAGDQRDAERLPSGAPRDPEDAERTLFAVISERTGYPVSMLRRHMNLESDLGIDSIKRTEILAEFRRRVAGIAASEMEALSRMKTPDQILEFVAGDRDAAASPGPGPFVREVVSLIPGREAVVRCELSLEEDLFLRDHTLGGPPSLMDEDLIGLPVVPLTVSMEMLAEAASLLRPGQAVVGMTNVRAYRWIALDRERSTLELVAVRAGSDQEVLVRLREATPDPAREGHCLPIIEGTVLFGDRGAAPERVPSFALRDARPSKWPSGAMYHRTGMFHGPLFQLVQRMDRTGSDGAEAMLVAQPSDRWFRSRPNPSFVIDPALLDAMGQVVGYWVGDLFQHGLSVFPFALARLDIRREGLAPGQQGECRLRARSVTDEHVLSDIEVAGEDGSLLVRMTGWEDRRLDLPRALYDFRVSPSEVFLSEPLAPPLGGLQGSATLRARRVRLPREVLESHGAIWLRVLAFLVLDRAEREIWHSLAHASGQRRTEWLIGRIAAKDAVRHLVRDRQGLVLSPADVEIQADVHGKPRAVCVRGGLEPMPAVSLAHVGDEAVAVAAHDPDGGGLGIDMERIDRVRPEVVSAAFTRREQALLDELDETERAEWSTRIWCAKEAVGKALGRGLTGGPLQFEVQDWDRPLGVLRVAFSRSLVDDLELRSSSPIAACTARDDGVIVAAARVPGTQAPSAASHTGVG